MSLLLLLLQQSHIFIDNLPRRDFWDYVSLCSTFALVIIAAITFLEVRRQAIETAKAAKAAADSVNEMKGQAAILVSKERARLVIERVELTLMDDSERHGAFPKHGDRIAFTIMCYGTTPAQILEAWTTVAVSEWQGSTKAMHNRLPLPLPEMIRNDDTGVERLIHIDSETDEAMDGFCNAEHKFRFALEFRVAIKYRDVFQKKASWTTTSRYIWMVTLHEEDQQRGGFTSSQEYEHVNREDENAP